jgi:hypothetical protein
MTFDSTAVSMAAANAAPVPPTPGGDKPPAGDSDKGKEGARPASSELITSILEKHGLESPEQLGEFIDSLAGMKGKLGEADLDELLENNKTMQRYRAQWAKQEREKLEEGETPEQTIARLKKEADDRDKQHARSEQKQKQTEKAKQAVTAFESTINSAIKADESIPAEYRPFMAALLGVKNPINDVDITDPAAIRKVAKEFGPKMVRDLEQAVIARYRAGKIEIVTPPVPGGGEPPVAAEVQPKNSTEMRRAAHQTLGPLLRKMGWGGGG